MTIVYLCLNLRVMEAWDFVEVTALWLCYGGYNSLMGLRDKKIDNQPEATSDEGDIKIN